MTVEERSVILGVLSFAWEPDDQCFAGVETIGPRVSMSRSATYRALNSAIAKGFLVKEPRRGFPKQSAYRIPLEWWAQDPTSGERRSKNEDSSVPPAGQVSSHQRDSSVPPAGLEGDGLEIDDHEGSITDITLSISAGGGGESQGKDPREPKGKKAKTPPEFRRAPPRAMDDEATWRKTIIGLLNKLDHPPRTPKEQKALVQELASYLAEYFTDAHSYEQYCKVIWDVIKGRTPASVIKKAFAKTVEAVADGKIYSNIPAFFFGCVKNNAKDKHLEDDAECSRPVESSGDIQEP